MEIFILPSGSGTADIMRAKASTISFANRLRLVKSLAGIKAVGVQRGWYMVLYDNEFVDDNLAKAIPVYMQSDFEILECFKRTEFGTGYQKLAISPRIFNKKIKLSGNSLIPAHYEKLKATKILDGWIEENVHAVDRS